jgi:hypothetical protein
MPLRPVLSRTDRAWGACFGFALTVSPSSTSRRTAADRVVSFVVAHAINLDNQLGRHSLSDVRVAASLPGRPRFFFGVTFMDFFMILGVTKKQAEGKVILPPRL